MKKHFYRFAYHARPQEDRTLDVHRTRDAEAFIELSRVLFQPDDVYGGLILNYPATLKDDGSVDSPRIAQYDKSRLTGFDILVLTTRPPLDDVIFDTRKIVDRSHSTLEEEIFNMLRRYLKHCARTRVDLSEPMAAQLPEGYENWAEIEFKQFDTKIVGDATASKGMRAHNKGYLKKPKGSEKTVFYLLYTPALWPGGPRLLSMWGMGGRETLIWAYKLRTKYWKEWELDLETTRFVMAEMEIQGFPPRPADLSFADNWEMNPVINTDFAPPSANHISQDSTV